MRFFIDTEFKEYFKQHRIFGLPVGYKTPTIDLISIAMVAENGSQIYLLNKECDLKEAWKDEWLQVNVLLPIYKHKVHGDMRNVADFTYNTMKWIFRGFGKTRSEIASTIIAFVHDSKDKDEPQFYGYYSDYDWVVFCQLFGRMIDLPKGFPMYCIDLKQMMDDLNLGEMWKSAYHPNPIGEHNAIVDAMWNMELYKKLRCLHRGIDLVRV